MVSQTIINIAMILMVASTCLGMTFKSIEAAFPPITLMIVAFGVLVTMFIGSLLF